MKASLTVSTRRLSRDQGAQAVGVDGASVSYLRRPRGGLVKLADDAMATLLSFAQLSDTAPEAGGVLIGRHILGGSDVVVDRVTIPMAGDRRARTRFAEAAGGIR